MSAFSLTDDCGGHINLTSNTLHTISSPGYPKFYDRGLNCYWLIQVSMKKHVSKKYRAKRPNTAFLRNIHAQVE